MAKKGKKYALDKKNCANNIPVGNGNCLVHSCRDLGKTPNVAMSAEESSRQIINNSKHGYTKPQKHETNI